MKEAVFGKGLRSLFWTLAILLFFSWPGYLQNGDNACMIATAEAMVHERGMLIDAVHQPARPGMPPEPLPGKVYSRFGIGTGLMLVPFVWVEDAAARAMDPGLARHVVFSLVSPLAALASLLVFWRVVRELSGSDAVATWIGLATFGFTILFPYSVYDGYELPQTLFLLLTVRAAFRDRWWEAGGWLAVLVLVKITNILLAPCFLILLLRQRDAFLRRVVRFGIPVVVAVGVVLVANYWRFGEAAEFGYGRDAGRFSLTNLRRHCIPLLFSNEMGFFNFSPVLLLGWFGVRRFFRAQRWIASFAAATLVSQWLLYGAFFEPKGSMCWGPRYLAPFVPLAALPLAFLDFRRFGIRAAAVLLVGASVLVNFISIAQRPLAYDVLREQSFGRVYAGEPQIAGCWKMWMHKVSSGGDLYPLALFEKGRAGIWDGSGYESFRGVNAWYWQAAQRYGMPGLRWLALLHLAAMLIAAGYLLRLTGDAWRGEIGSESGVSEYSCGPLPAAKSEGKS